MMVAVFPFEGGTLLEGYKTVGKLVHTEYIEKRSKFIGHICAVKTEEEAQNFIQIGRAHV